MSSLNQLRRLRKGSQDEDQHFKDEMDQLLDLSNIKNISELNRIRNQDDDQEINVDQIEVDLDEDELAEMERIMRTKMNFANGESESNSPQVGSGKINIQDVIVDTPPSNYGYNDTSQEEPEDKKLKKLEQQKLFQQNQHQQIQRELRELLAQSSSEQLLLINDENEKINEVEFEVKKKESSSPPQVSSNINTPQSDGTGARGRQATSTTPVDNNSTPSPKIEAANNMQMMPPQIPKKYENSEAGDLMKSQKKKSGSSERLDKADPTFEKKEEKEGNDDNDSFHRLYNKEIKVNQDEIPLLLLELTDIAYKFIKKDQYEKAYVLLQKTESVLEVVNLEHSKRDRYFAYITYHNMAMCFQKLGMLEECIIYLKETISVIDKSNFFKDVSISQRMKQMHMQCQLKLQLCAILSQTQKHTEAMENAKISVRLGHQILRDMYDLCVFYSNKIKFKDDFASLSLILMDEIENEQKKSNEKLETKHTKSEINEKLMHKQYIRDNSPVRDIPFNILEESISMIERTALKLLPIMKELGCRLAGINGQRGQQAFHIASQVKDTQVKDLKSQKEKLREDLNKKKKANGPANSDDEDDERDIKDADFKVGQDPVEKKDGDQIDMRTVLGFLNQNEWILNLNIGNIMQIQPVRMKDFMQSYRNEHQLSRESFLEKLQLVVVSYFCVSTEMRFIVQSRSGFMKPEVKKEKELEQEYWHVKALEIACAFLPSECPLFNHILLSYQKHHDPTMHPIKEDEEQQDVISVLRPLKGIENSKYQPLVRELNNVYIDIAEIPVSPLSKCFDHRLIPKKVKTTSMNIQTDPIEKPRQPLMKSQSISVQEDLRVEKKVSAMESQTSTDVFDANNAYMDLSNSKYEENLLSKIIDDPNINDKHQFLGKLIGRVQSQDPDRFMKGGSVQHNGGYTYANTLSQNLNIVHSHMVSFQQPNNADTNTTLSLDPSHDAPYGGKKLANKGNKQTQSGQISYNRGSRESRGTTKNKNTNFEQLDFKSFDQKSQIFNNHVVSLYGDATSNDATTINYGAKHHIASQSLAPSQSVLTEQQKKVKQSHKKSISGGNSVDIFMKKDRNLNHSVNSISSTKYGGTKKKSTLNQDNIKISNNKLLSGLKNNSNINLSNQKNQQLKKPTKYLQNANAQRSDSKDKTVTKEKIRKQKVHKVPIASGNDILMKEINDVMSQSSQNDSNPDPDLHPLPESSCSDTGGKKSPIQILQHKQDDSIMVSDNNLPKATNVAIKRPSSAITNYTSGTLNGANSGIKGRQSKQRLQNVQNQNRANSSLKVTKVQQQQNIVTQVKQGKQKAIYSGAPLVPKKKTKVLSRKKYGSDRSSDSPMRGNQFTSQEQQPPGYSIAQHPGYSIFDSGNTHSISKMSQQPQQHQNSKQSISNFAQGENVIRNNEFMLRKKSKAQHSNSQTLQVDKKLKNTTKTLKNDTANNQSENILAKLQNLLQNREDDKKEMQKKIDKRSQNLNSQNVLRDQRGGYVNSNGSIKSRVSRSKSSGNGRSKDAIAPNNNNSLMFQSQNSQQELNDRGSFDKKVARSSALRSRPKSSMELQKKKPSSKKAPSKAPAQGNSSIENLQRQVLENQKILLNIQSQNSQKQSKRNTGFFTKHNHNNSISHMTTNLQGIAPLKSQMQTQNLRNQIGNKSILSSGQSNSGISGISGKKKINRKIATATPNQNILNSQNASQILQSLAQNMQNIKKDRVSGSGSVQAQQKRRTSKFRRASISGNFVTNNSAPGNGKFINFEQMQQQLEVGGVDLQKEAALMQQGFQPHKNLMPKTTGSQAHLLNIQEAEKLTQKYNSLNQTGRTVNSFKKK